MHKFNFGRIAGFLWGVLYLGLAIFLFAAVVTYDSSDPSLNTVTNSAVVHNKMGLAGAYVADLFVQLFGVMSFAIVSLIALAGFNFIMLKRGGYNFYLKVIAFVVFMMSGCALLSKLFYVKNYLEYELWGGALGYYINSEIMEIPRNLLLALYFILVSVSLYILIDFNYLRLRLLVEKTFAVAIYPFKLLFRLLYGLLSGIVRVLTPRTVVNRIKMAVAKIRYMFSKNKIKQKEYEDVLRNQSRKIEDLEKHIETLNNGDKKEGNKKEENKKEEGRNKDINENGDLEIKPMEKNEKKAALFSFLHRDNRQNFEGNYMLPTVDLLNSASSETVNLTKEELKIQAGNLLRVLREYKITGKIISVKVGPIITLHEFEPSAGTKSSRIIGCADDIARNLKVESARISVIPERNVVGIELPNRQRNIIFLKDILELNEYKNSKYALPIVLGSDIAGNPVITDLAKSPHLLIAGTTGSGKSVCINTIILSLLYKFHPDECKMIMIDPKMLELSAYDGIPHLLMPVVTDSKKAVMSLKWVVSEMENRYRVMSGLGVRNIYGYNEKVRQAIRNNTQLGTRTLIGYDEYGEPMYTNKELEAKQLPFIVVIVDEMADLMITTGKDIEALIQRIAQMARAAGIHIVMATQRPSVDVITGVIKANFPSRISFLVSSRIDSKVVLGEQGAEQLLGMGDMLYMQNGGKINRAHGPFVSDAEVEKVVEFIVKQGFKPEFIKISKENDSSLSSENDEDGEDENFDINIMGQKDDEALYQQAIEIIKRDKKVSISYIQRQLRIGYNKSAILIERMEKDGIISPVNTTGKRDILKN